MQLILGSAGAAAAMPDRDSTVRGSSTFSFSLVNKLLIILSIVYCVVVYSDAGELWLTGDVSLFSG
jgi:hypothetical protein